MMGATMTDTQELLKRIAALRVRLDQAQGLMHEADAAAAQLVGEGAPQNGTSDFAQRVAALDQKVRHAAWHGSLLDSALRPLTDAPDPAAAPPRLIGRAARLLQRGRDLLHDLRSLLDDPVIRADETEPLTCLHGETAGMLDVLLRVVQVFPPSPSAQIRLCEGLEAVLQTIEERLNILLAGLAQRRLEHERLECLADLFRKLGAGHVVPPQHFFAIAEALVHEVGPFTPLRFLSTPADDPARFVAAHSLNTAQVLVRLLRDDPDWQQRREDAVFATLLHDVGMVRVPAHFLTQEGPLSDEQRRLVERHPNVGAHIISRILPGGGLAVEAATDHHERIDGTGYPAGRRDIQLSRFVRLLSVCDFYAALCTRRPYREARETRTALTDTLLLADQGAFDRVEAEKLLRLSFYPPGSVVELSDGAIGIVIAVHPGQLGMSNPAKPIVSLLTGPGGKVQAVPATVDLVHDERTVLRTLPESERRSHLWRKYPALA